MWIKFEQFVKDCVDNLGNCTPQNSCLVPSGLKSQVDGCIGDRFMVFYLRKIMLSDNNVSFDIKGCVGKRENGEVMISYDEKY